MAIIDNPYLVEFDPQEFMEVWEIMTSELEHTEKEETPEHYKLVKRVVERLKQADKRHICKDEGQHSKTERRWQK